MPTSPPPAGVPVPPTFSVPPVTVPTSPNNTVTGSPGLPTPDIGQTTSAIVIPTFPLDANTNQVSDVAQVTVRIVSLTHPRLADLELDLISPLGRQVVLAHAGSMRGSNLVNTVFTDSATTNIMQGTATYTGSFRPTESLAKYNGRVNPIGQWVLVVRDTVTGEVGVLRDWSLTVIPTVSAPDVTVFQDQNGGNVDYPIPDSPVPGVNIPQPYARANSPLNVTSFPIDPNTNQRADVQSLTVDIFNLTHPDLSHLQIELVGPDGSKILIAAGLAGADMVNTQLDDAAATPIAAGTAPYTGSFRPTSSFGGFTGNYNPIGTWQLIVTDQITGQTGVIRDWGLTVTPVNGLAPVTVTQDTTFGGNDIVIPDALGAVIPLESTIPITTFPIDPNTNQEAAVARVEVNVGSIDHERLSDLRIEIVSPLGRRVTLVSPGQMQPVNSFIFDANFSDNSNFLITNDTPPYGFTTYRPASPLSVFNGFQSPVGNWTLVVTDTRYARVGVLDDWSITITPVNGLPAVTEFSNFPLNLDIPDAALVPSGGYSVSTITAPALPAGMVTGDVVVGLNLDHPNVGDLWIGLEHNGTIVTLVDQRGRNPLIPSQSGDNFTNTRFDDNATQGINNAIEFDAPFTGPWRAEPGSAFIGANGPGTEGMLPLSQFAGMDPAGEWRLIVVDLVSQNTGALKNWSLSILPGRANSVASQSPGNYVDQNANSRQLELPAQFPATSDAYTVPATQAGIPFQGPYQVNTLPISVTGPYVLRTSVLGQTANIASVTPVVGQRSLTVTFDRAVDPLTFTGASISRVTQFLGGTGTDLSGTFTVTPLYPGATGTVVPGTPTTTYRIDGLADPTVFGATYAVVTRGSVEASDNVAVNTGASGIKVTFNRDMDVSTFTPADILSVVGPNGNVPIFDAQNRPLVQVAPVNPVNGLARQFTVTFIKYNPTTNAIEPDGQSFQGAYSLVIGPNIQSANQSQLVVSLPFGTTALNVTFDRDIIDGEPSPLDTLQVFGPNGPLSGAFTLTPVAGAPRTFTLGFPSAVQTPGQYVFDFSNQVTALTPADVTADGFNLTLTFTSPVALTPEMILAVLGPNGPIVGANGTSAPTAVTPVNPTAGKATTWTLTFPDQIPTTPQQDKLKPGTYAVSYKNPYKVALGTLSVTLAAPSSAMNIVFPQPVLNLNITSVYRVLNSAGQPVIGPASLAPTVVNGVADTTGTRYTLSFPDQNPTTGTLDPVPAGTYTVLFTTSAKLDTNWNAGLDLLLGGDALTGQVKTISNASTSPSVSIPANGTASMPLFVPQDVLIDQNLSLFPDRRIELLLNITHPDVTDLDLFLVAPDGTRIQLFTGALIATPAPNAAGNFINTRLADETDPARGTPIQSAQPPFTPVPATRVFVPQFPLSRLVGTRSLGTWTLEVRNNGTLTGNGPDGQIEIENWSLVLPFVDSGNGLGETYADRYTAGFRVFTQDTTQQVSQFAWTPVGASPTNDAVYKNTGRATAVAVDPSDPSGNTVFVGGATGGVWKTTNFLTQDAAGPSWVPLTDFSLRNGMNISHITVVPRNNDTNKSIVYALTGSADRYLGDVTVPQINPGVGLLRSLNGGLTWELLDSSTNVVGNTVTRFGDPSRDHVFSGAYGMKIIADPRPNPTPNATGSEARDVILYMAVSESPDTPAALRGVQGGIWRSTNGGDSWTRLTLLDGAGGVVTGQGTDVALAAGSAGSSGNLQYLYAAVSGPNGGVYYSSQSFGTSSLQIADGSVNPSLGVGNGNVQYVGLQTPVPVAVTGTPTGNRGRVVLAVPSLDTASALANSFYQGWVYAFIANANGSLNGLYQTKDFGRNWTRIEIPVLTLAGDVAYGSNNEAQRPDHDIFAKIEASAPDTGNMNISIAVDPQNPNIVYLGGLGAGNDISQPAGGLIRIDTTVVNNSQTLVFHDNSAGGVGPQTEAASAGGISGDGGLLEIQNTGLPGVTLYQNRRSDLSFEASDFINLYRDPNNPFKADSVLYLTPPPPLGATGSFTNNGQNARWRPFTEFIQTGRRLDSSTGQPGGDQLVPEPLATGIHRMLTLVDPVTGLTRLIAVTDQGVYTGVDRGDGVMASSIGSLPVQNRSRNGNLQLGQYYSGAVQPTQAAADIAGALFYAMSQDNGFPVSSPNELRTGNSGYNGQLFNPFVIDITRALSAPELRPGSGTQVVVDQTGTGTSYQYRQPAAMGNGAALVTFFRVFSPPGTAADPTGPGQGSTQGLVRGNGADVPINDVGQWPIRDNEMGYFAANPIDPNGLVIGSEEGRVYRSFTRGAQWDPIGPAALVNAGGANMIRAAAFGAPPKDVGNNSTQVNNFIYVGTQSGQVWVTFNAGGAWTNITSNLPGDPILKIVADPRRSSTATPFRDLYVTTPNGVFYMADSGAATPTWVNLTGNLFTFTKGLFKSTDPLDQLPAMTALTSMAADWRFSFPLDANDPAGAVRPDLYVSGDGGVFKLAGWTLSPAAAPTWEFYPAAATYTDQFGNTVSVPDGGRLPDVNVTDIDISNGAIDPATGLPTPPQFDPNTGTVTGGGGLNLLLATTFGRGQWAIRLDPNDVPSPNFVKGPKVVPTSVTVRATPPGVPTTAINVTFDQGVDPGTFTAADIQLLRPDGTPVTITGVTMISPTAANGSNPRNQYEITFAAPTVTGDYTLTIGYNPGGLGRSQAAGVPEIAGLGGEFMNQNDNTTNGEAGISPTGDQFQTTVRLAVNPGPAAGVTITPTTPAPFSVGLPVTFNVNVVDASGATTQDNGPITVTLTPPDGSATITTTAVSNGQGSFTITWATAGTYTITTSVGGSANNVNGTLTGVQVVQPGTPAAVSLTTTVAGPYSRGQVIPVTVRVVDSGGALVPTVNGPVTLALSPNDPAAVFAPSTVTLVNGQATFNLTFGTVGNYTLTGSVTTGSGTVTGTLPFVVTTPQTGRLAGSVAVGSGEGGSPNVNVYDSTGNLQYSVNPFPPGFNGQVDPFSVGFTGGNRVALGRRVDGSTFTVIGTGPTISNWVKVIDNGSGQEVLNYQPFEATFKGGIFVSVGDVDGDGTDEIIITPDQTGGPRVTILRGTTFQVMANFFGINDPNFRGGARAGVGDINGDGFGEVVVSAGFGGGPRISVYDGRALSMGRISHPIPDFFIFEDTLRNGAYVAVGDVNGDGRADIIGGAGPGGGPRILALSGADLLNKPVPKVTPVANFFAGNINNRGGIRVTAKNLDGDKYADIVVGDGDGAGSLVTSYRGSSLAANGTDVVYSFDAFPGINAGVFVG